MNLEVRDDSDACWGATIVYVEQVIENAMTDGNIESLWICGQVITVISGL